MPQGKPKNRPALWTVGYEFATPATLAAALKAHGITTLLDVRELPASRRPGFSKRALAGGLEKEGIAYRHLRALGTPKEGREANKRGAMRAFWAIVEAALATPEAAVALDEAATLAREGPTCLLCLEGDPARCHRSRVAELLAERGFDVQHLRLARDPGAEP